MKWLNEQGSMAIGIALAVLVALLASQFIIHAFAQLEAGLK